MEDEIKHSYQAEYIRKIEIVQDYLESHIKEEINIERLASIVGFSKYHFSRIFQSILNESLAHYVNRLRMEKALFFLAHREDLSITDICFEVGYKDSNVFSRAFKKYYGISPLAFRKKYSKNCKESIYLSDYNKSVEEKEQLSRGYPIKGEIRIENLCEQDIVYVRHIGTYESLAKVFSHLIKDLFKYAKKQNLVSDDRNKVLVMYHDNPEFTEAHKFRTSICLPIPEGIKAHEDHKMGVAKIIGGQYAIGYFDIKPEEFPDAWNYMYREWLLGSGYVPQNAVPYEVYLNDPSKEVDGRIKVELCVPIEPFLL